MLSSLINIIMAPDLVMLRKFWMINTVCFVFRNNACCIHIHCENVRQIDFHQPYLNDISVSLHLCHLSRLEFLEGFLI